MDQLKYFINASYAGLKRMKVLASLVACILHPKQNDKSTSDQAADQDRVTESCPQKQVRSIVTDLHVEQQQSCDEKKDFTELEEHASLITLDLTIKACLFSDFYTWPMWLHFQ